MSTSGQNFVLLGNPNIGKSSLFNRLTGLRQKVGNFAGVTIEKKSGKITIAGEDFSITDLPGSYSLVPRSPDEEVVANEILAENKNTSCILVADASNLARNLLLFSQIADLEMPAILAITMADVAEKRSIKLDTAMLEKRTGCPVVIVNPRTGEGIAELKKRLPEACVPSCRFFSEQEETGSFREWLQNVRAERRQEKSPDLDIARETTGRLRNLREMLSGVERKNEGRENPGNGYFPDKIALHPVWGYLLMLAILLIVFEGVFTLSSYPVDLLDAGMDMAGVYLSGILPEGILREFLLGGVLAGIQGIVVFVPQIAILFFLIGILEQSGYMARVMLLLDRLMGKMGLSGKSVVPLVSGLACAVPAIMATRNMSSSRERLIAIFVTPLMSCSARLPVFSLLVAILLPENMFWAGIPAQGLAMLALYLLGLAGAVLTAFLMHSLLPGKGTGNFILEIPPYKVPGWSSLLTSVYHKSSAFVLEAGKIILAISVILWFMAAFGPGDGMQLAEKQAHTEVVTGKIPAAEESARIAALQLEASYAGIAGQWIEPAIRPLGFDWKIGVALISSFAAREVFVGTMSVLYASGSEEETEGLKSRMRSARHPDTGLPVFTAATIISLLVFYIFAMQCMSTLAVTYRETQSVKWPALQLIYMTFLAFSLSFLAFRLFS
jgi:ferrous iron transport protein B